MNQQQTLLSLDDAATTLNLNRRELAGYITALDIKRQRGDDRRSYLATQDLKKIQSFKEEKSNPSYFGLTMMSDVPQPRQMSRNTKSYAEEGYGNNESIFKVVGYIAQNGAAIPPKLYTDRTMSKEITNHPLLDKLDNPNTEQSGVDYREAVLGWYLIVGNSFQLSIRKGVKGAPDELWTLDATRVHPIPKKTQGIIGYNFDDYPDNMNPIDPANIGHMRTWNPLDPIFGLSPISVGAIIIDQQLSARRWNLALLQNMAKPPGAWVVKTVMDQNSRNKLETKLNDKMSGARNAGRVPVLDGGMEWVPTAANPSELDWLKSLQYNAGQLANLYNIAPQLIGDTSASTYNNMEEAKSASYTEAIFPALDRMYALWRNWLLPMYPDLCDAQGKPTAYLYYDKTTVEVVQAVIQARLSAAVERANKAWMQGSCMLDEARDMQDLPPLPNGMGQVYRFGAVLVRQQDMAKYAEQSLQKPAAPPTVVPENLLDALMPGQPATPPAESDEDEQETPPKKPAGKPKKPAKPSQQQEDETPPKSKAAFTDAERTALVALRSRLHGMKKLAPATHKVWECAIGACEFCLQNDGEVVAIDDDFPNGCSTPDDCHRFCKCSEWELSLPDDITLDDYSAHFLISAYATHFIEGRHDRDVAAQQAAQEQSDVAEYADEEDDSDTYAAAIARVQKRAKRKGRDEYRNFMDEVLQ